MKIALLTLFLIIAILAFGTRNEAQAVIEDTTVGQTVGLRSASEETARLPIAMPNGVRDRPLAVRTFKQRVSGPPVLLVAGIGSPSNAATDAIASTNPADWQTCSMVRNGPIRRPDNYSPSPHSRKADNA